jgi:hypothetical protein
MRVTRAANVGSAHEAVFWDDDGEVGEGNEDLSESPMMGERDLSSPFFVASEISMRTRTSSSNVATDPDPDSILSSQSNRADAIPHNAWDALRRMSAVDDARCLMIEGRSAGRRGRSVEP